MTDSIIVCRCEDITLAEIRAAIEDGKHSIDEIKRTCRCGMGPCQGRNCIPLIVEEIARQLNKPVGEVELPTFRPPASPIKLGVLAGGAEND
ncbi:MAG TPA: (2Fe-2S)-binding protein [Methylomusa anaerophila]|uniref:Hydrogen cyanide synthase subunit HcnB n=1 Tax=Methylomusa anaerophila TaxID=1930071 RepID=A0A348APK2_9FIRM|nr:(2Fe-2S)-binding protein [Methylomusa anaerophila]BBB93000.1 hydrogen cyanide synthase subunit HcnB [Methylomusa anaerophila]HML87167.1 (2Fe-2S)-binding protein [Methylomusa anaerophila]